MSWRLAMSWRLGNWCVCVCVVCVCVRVCVCGGGGGGGQPHVGTRGGVGSHLRRVAHALQVEGEDTRVQQRSDAREGHVGLTVIRGLVRDCRTLVEYKGCKCNKGIGLAGVEAAREVNLQKIECHPLARDLLEMETIREIIGEIRGVAGEGAPGSVRSRWPSPGRAEAACVSPPGFHLHE